LGSVLDYVIADEQEKKSSLSDAQLRRQHVPLFAQLYKTKPVMDLERLLHEVIDEAILEAADGKFNLTKEILHVSGFRAPA
jgi:hypothetical protein